MKKLFFLILLATMPVIVVAQTQQGYVRTKGRIVNGVFKPGKPLGGVKVTIRGGLSVLSDKNGSFSFPVTNNKFHVMCVHKDKYVLTDKDVLTREYSYHSNPLVFVMETKEQQMIDQLAAERQIRRTLQQQLQKKADEIETLKISQQKKDSLIRILYQQQGDNEKLISDMAERYSKMDFEAMDDFNRCISQLILEGKLAEADSLLNTKGDINRRISQLIMEGKLTEADSLFSKRENVKDYTAIKEELENSQKKLQNEAYDLVIECNIKGKICQEKGNYEKALEWYNMALAIQEEFWGKEHPDAQKLRKSIENINAKISTQ